MAITKSRPLSAGKFARVSSIMLRDQRLSTRDKMVYVALCEFQDPSGRCWPSVTSLSRISGLGRTAIHEALIVLQSLGYIERQTRIATSNYYVLDTVPINDLFDDDGNSADGHVSTYPPGGERCSPREQWEGSEGELLVFDQRTGKLRFADNPPSQDEHKEEKEIEKIKELWKEGLSASQNPLGTEKSKNMKAFLYYYRHFGASVATVESLITMVKQSSFLQGQNERRWKPSLWWCLKNRERILSGTYSNYREKSGDIEITLDD